jgi:hypothetical protein
MEITDLQKIQILLAEYSSLRAEIVARIGHMYQLFGFGIAVIALLFIQLKPFRFLSESKNGEPAHLRKRRILFGSLLVLFGVLFAWSVRSYDRDIKHASARIREIELDVNDRAQEDLLVWENLWGDAATGLWWPGSPLPRSRLEAGAAPARTFQGKDVKR